MPLLKIKMKNNYSSLKKLIAINCSHKLMLTLDF